MKTQQNQYPIVIRPTLRALVGRSLPKLLFWVPFALICLNNGYKIAFYITLFFLARHIFFYLVPTFFRILHTEYLIYSNRIEVNSYGIFRTSGYNRTVSINALKDFSAYINSRLDYWFFGCGGIVLTVSGSWRDLILENIYGVGQVRDIIINTAFRTNDSFAYRQIDKERRSLQNR